MGRWKNFLLEICFVIIAIIVFGIGCLIVIFLVFSGLFTLYQRLGFSEIGALYATVLTIFVPLLYLAICVRISTSIERYEIPILGVIRSPLKAFRIYRKTKKMVKLLYEANDCLNKCLNAYYLFGEEAYNRCKKRCEEIMENYYKLEKEVKNEVSKLKR